MALKLLAIGCIKSGTKICGYRLIDYNEAVKVTEQNHQVKYLDLPSNAIIAAIKNNQVVVDNLSVVNGELRGSNGQASRYGAVDASTKQARNQVMVIVGEVRDKKDLLVGYICSDTDGRIIRLFADQAVAQAGRLGLANGKLVDNGKGSRHISAISGGYSTLRLSYNYSDRMKSDSAKQAEQPKPKPVDPPKPKPVEQPKEADTQKSEDANLYNKAMKLIVELDKHEKFKADFSFKVAASVRRWRKCSEKQYAVLEKAYEKFIGQKKPEDKPTEEVKNTVTTEPAKEEQTKETVVPEKPVKKLRNNSIYASGIKSVDVDVSDTSTNGSTVQPNAVQAVAEDPVEDRSVAPQATETAQETNEEPKVSLDDIIKNSRTPGSKLNLPVSDLGIFDFGVINDEIYVRGFKDGIEVPENVILPDSVRFRGADQPVVGIAIEAFKGREIVRFKTGKYIRDIGAGAFFGCKKLEILDLSESTHSMIPANMAYCCPKLRSVHLGNNIDRIHELAFFSCRRLELVDGGSNVDTIARQAFAFCDKLSIFKPRPKFINEGAFEQCFSLSENGFSFENIANIGTKALRGTGFRKLVIPGNVKTVGKKAFADCALLQTVMIEEGVEFVDTYCFAKSRDNCLNNIRTYKMFGMTENEVYFDLELIDTPKSLKDVGNDAFRHVLLVKVFTGSASESVCIGFNVPYDRKDKVTMDNSSKARFRSQIMSADIIKLLHNDLNRAIEGECNPQFEIDTTKLLNAQLNMGHINGLKFKTPSAEPLEPHIKFKAALKYTTDLAKPFTLPLTSNILRFTDIMKIETTELFGDGWNEIYKTTFFKRDTLESGSFITFMQGLTLLYIAEASSALDIELTPDAYSDKGIFIKTHLHAGDKIGNDSTIDGKNASRLKYESEDGYVLHENVGLKFYNRIKENSIIIRATRTTYIYYVPAENCALVLFDSRKDKDESVYRNNSKYAYFTVTKILDYNELLEYIASDKYLKTDNSDSYAFFSNLSQISQSEANRIISAVKYVAEESYDTLFDAGLKCEAMLKAKKMLASDMTPDMLTYDMFSTLTESYWMVEKDLDWYESISAKSLNKTNEYQIGSYTVIEYRSNQVVKFNNPYMHGKKNSMIFVLKRGNQIFGIYASIYSLATIASMLADLTYMPDGYKENAPQLMTRADVIEQVDPKYFYHFYDVLQTTGDWDLQKNYGGFISSFLYCLKSSFHLSMYKPTGVFYLTMDTYVLNEEKDPTTGKKVEKTLNKVTYPIFPIGDMDRALMVADTTNTNNRYARFKEELVQLAIYERAKASNSRYTPSREFPDIDPINYYKVRQMSMDGVQETFEYAKFVDDRAAFMIGRVHKGELRMHGMEPEFDEFDEQDVYDDSYFEDEEDDTEFSDEVDDADFEEFDDDAYFADVDDEDDEDY